MDRSLIETAFNHELSLYEKALSEKNDSLCVLHLGRAHIISQRQWNYHLYVHYLMLCYSWSRRDIKEILGQLLRLVLTLPGHLIQILPKGNIGWSSVHFNKEMEIPHDLKKYFE